MNIRATATFQAGNFARLESLIVPRITRAVENATQEVFDETQAIVPVITGELQASGKTEVTWEATRVTGDVAYYAHHASFVEFGTGLRGAGTYPYDLPTAGVPLTGSWIYDFRNQGWVGQQSQPYLRPALDTKRAAILAAFAAEFPV